MSTINTQHCDRCGQPTPSRILSINVDWLCDVCKLAETHHPSYKEAVEADVAALKRGKSNLPASAAHPNSMPRLVEPRRCPALPG